MNYQPAELNSQRESNRFKQNAQLFTIEPAAPTPELRLNLQKNADNALNTLLAILLNDHSALYQYLTLSYGPRRNPEAIKIKAQATLHKILRILYGSQSPSSSLFTNIEMHKISVAWLKRLKDSERDSGFIGIQQMQAHSSATVETLASIFIEIIINPLEKRLEEISPEKPLFLRELNKDKRNNKSLGRLIRENLLTLTLVASMAGSGIGYGLWAKGHRGEAAQHLRRVLQLAGPLIGFDRSTMIYDAFNLAITAKGDEGFGDFQKVSGYILSGDQQGLRLYWGEIRSENQRARIFDTAVSDRNFSRPVREKQDYTEYYKWLDNYSKQIVDESNGQIPLSFARTFVESRIPKDTAGYWEYFVSSEVILQTIDSLNDSQNEHQGPLQYHAMIASNLNLSQDQYLIYISTILSLDGTGLYRSERFSPWESVVSLALALNIQDPAELAVLVRYLDSHTNFTPSQSEIANFLSTYAALKIELPMDDARTIFNLAMSAKEYPDINAYTQRIKTLVETLYVGMHRQDSLHDASLFVKYSEEYGVDPLEQQNRFVFLPKSLQNARGWHMVMETYLKLSGEKPLSLESAWQYTQSYAEEWNLTQEDAFYVLYYFSRSTIPADQFINVAFEVGLQNSDTVAIDPRVRVALFTAVATNSTSIRSWENSKSRYEELLRNNTTRLGRDYSSLNMYSLISSFQILDRVSTGVVNISLENMVTEFENIVLPINDDEGRLVVGLVKLDSGTDLKNPTIGDLNGPRSYLAIPLVVLDDFGDPLSNMYVRNIGGQINLIPVSKYDTYPLQIDSPLIIQSPTNISVIAANNLGGNDDERKRRLAEMGATHALEPSIWVKNPTQEGQLDQSTADYARALNFLISTADGKIYYVIQKLGDDMYDAEPSIAKLTNTLMKIEQRLGVKILYFMVQDNAQSSLIASTNVDGEFLILDPGMEGGPVLDKPLEDRYLISIIAEK